MEHEKLIYGSIDDSVRNIFSGDVAGFTKGVYSLHDLLHEQTVYDDTKAYVRAQLNEHGGLDYINKFIAANELSHIQGYCDDIQIAINGEFLAGCNIVLGPVLSLAAKFFTNIIEG